MIEAISKRLKGDRYLWLFTILLTVFSLLVVYSSTESLAFRDKKSLEFFLFKHLLYSLAGLVIMVIFHYKNYRVFLKWASAIYWFTVPLLIYTTYFGPKLNDAARWIKIPFIGLTFQTSDLAKIAMVLFLSKTLSQGQEKVNDWRFFFRCVTYVGIIFLIIFPTNLSTAAMLFGAGMVLMFIGRINTSKLILFGATGIVLVSFFVMFSGNMDRGETWKARLERFMNSDGGEEQIQTKHAKIAVVSGGIFGMGPGNGKQKNYLPHAYSDFVFAIIVEEYGLMGAIAVFLLYLLIFQRGLTIARKCNTKFGALIAVGITFLMLVQAVVNMAVSLDLFPVTGQTLPLLSLGGSSQFITFASLGIIQSVARDAEESEAMSNPENVALT
jgi:cell division protein FtsW